MSPEKQKRMHLKEIGIAQKETDTEIWMLIVHHNLNPIYKDRILRRLEQTRRTAARIKREIILEARRQRTIAKSCADLAAESN